MNGAKDYLRADLPCIGHGKEEKYYKAIMNGETPGLLAIEDSGLADDVATADIEDDGHAASLVEVGVGVGVDGSPEHEEVVGEMKDLLALEDMDVASDEDADAPALLKDPEKKENPWAKELKAGKCGCFHLSVKKGTKYGGIQANCPFHKLRDNSGCKRVFRIMGPGFKDQLIAARLAT